MRVRDFIRSDIDYLRAIDVQSYGDPWEAEEFSKFGMFINVAIAESRPIGFSVLQGTKILRFGVNRNWRRMGVGSALMDTLKTGKLSILIPESNEGGQLFLRSQNFKCVNILKKKFTDCGEPEDGFYFIWKPGYERSA